MKKDIYILGIETSCDETAASVVKNGQKSFRMSLHLKLKVKNDLVGLFRKLLRDIMLSKLHS